MAVEEDEGLEGSAWARDPFTMYVCVGLEREGAGVSLKRVCSSSEKSSFERSRVRPPVRPVWKEGVWAEAWGASDMMASSEASREGRRANSNSSAAWLLCRFRFLSVDCWEVCFSALPLPTR